MLNLLLLFLLLLLSVYYNPSYDVSVLKDWKVNYIYYILILSVNVILPNLPYGYLDIN